MVSVRPIEGGWEADQFMTTSHPSRDDRQGTAADTFVEGWIALHYAVSARATHRPKAASNCAPCLPVVRDVARMEDARREVQRKKRLLQSVAKFSGGAWVALAGRATSADLAQWQSVAEGLGRYAFDSSCGPDDLLTISVRHLGPDTP